MSQVKCKGFYGNPTIICDEKKKSGAGIHPVLCQSLGNTTWNNGQGWRRNWRQFWKKEYKTIEGLEAVFERKSAKLSKV